MHAFRHSPDMAPVLAWDEFGLQIVPREAPPWRPGSKRAWTDDDDRRAAEWLQHRGILVGPETAGAAAQSVAMERQFHPVRDYLQGLKWDGSGRLDGWLATYCGAVASPYIHAIGARFIISAAARILRDVSKADTILVLEGHQGTGKSTAARTLFDPWFADHLPDLTSKDAFIQLAGKWCIEIAELAAFGRAEANRIKAFSSSAVDRYRPPYGKRSIDVPRQTVFIGTSNHSEYLRDETGNRRFWPVRCGSIDLDALARDRDQIWAEAVIRYHRGERWWLDTPELTAAAAEQTNERLEVDPWRDLVAEWIAAPRSRRDHTGHPVADIVSDGDGVTVADVLIHGLGKPVDRLQQADQNRVAKILAGLGRVRHQYRLPDGRRVWRYREAE